VTCLSLSVDMGKARWSKKQEEDLYTKRTRFDSLTWKEFGQLYRDQVWGPARTPQALCRRFRKIAEHRRRQKEPEEQEEEMNPPNTAFSDSGPDTLETIDSDWSLLREGLLPYLGAEFAAEITDGGPKHLSPEPCTFSIADNAAQAHTQGPRPLRHHSERFGRPYRTIPISALDLNAESTHGKADGTVRVLDLSCSNRFTSSPPLIRAPVVYLPRREM
jgi:hypothetical protein